MCVCVCVCVCVYTYTYMYVCNTQYYTTECILEIYECLRDIISFVSFQQKGCSSLPPSMSHSPLNESYSSTFLRQTLTNEPQRPRGVENAPPSVSYPLPTPNRALPLFLRSTNRLSPNLHAFTWTLLFHSFQTLSLFVRPV